MTNHERAHDITESYDTDRKMSALQREIAAELDAAEQRGREQAQTAHECNQRTIESLRAALEDAADERMATLTNLEHAQMQAEADANSITTRDEAGWRLVAALREIDAWLEDRQDADCGGDPARYIPNAEMVLRVHCVKPALAAVPPAWREKGSKDAK